MAFNPQAKQEELYSEEADYTKAEMSIKEIILRHIRKVGDICCQEFTGGYWDKHPVRTQSGVIFSETYHPDLREAYCNAVDFLVDIIYPKGDADLRKYVDENEKIETCYKDDEIDKKLKQKRKTFKEINLMFERTNFWNSQESYSE